MLLINHTPVTQKGSSAVFPATNYLKFVIKIQLLCKIKVENTLRNRIYLVQIIRNSQRENKRNKEMNVSFYLLDKIFI